MTNLENDSTIIEYTDTIRQAIERGLIEPHAVNQMMIILYRSYIEDTGNRPGYVGDPIRAVKLLLNKTNTPNGVAFPELT